MLKSFFLYFLIIFLLNSCAGTFDSVKRGMTGAKQKSTDEFLVQKKDPLILPPDFESLPKPENSSVEEEDISDFEKTLKENLPKEDISTSASSAEESILKKIQSK